jgi:hypothetical protein
MPLSWAAKAMPAGCVRIGHVIDLTHVYAAGSAGGPTPQTILRAITHHNGIAATL